MSELKPGQNFDHSIPSVLQHKTDVVTEAAITEAEAEATRKEAEAEAKAEADRKAARAEEGRRIADTAYAAAASAEAAASKAERATHDTIVANAVPPTPNPAPAVAVPNPLPVAETATRERRHANVEMLSLSHFTAPGQARHFLVDVWKRCGAKIALGCVIGTAVIGIVVAIAFGIFYASNRAGYSPETLVMLTHPTTTNAPTMAPPTPFVAPHPAPIPPGLLPPPVPARTEPGLQGARGSYVRMSARAAFPTSCATAGSRSSGLRGIRFFCGPNPGDDLCDCQVAGFVP